MSLGKAEDSRQSAGDFVSECHALPLPLVASVGAINQAKLTAPFRRPWRVGTWGIMPLHQAKNHPKTLLNAQPPSILSNTLPYLCTLGCQGSIYNFDIGSIYPSFLSLLDA